MRAEIGRHWIDRGALSAEWRPKPINVGQVWINVGAQLANDGAKWIGDRALSVGRPRQEIGGAEASIEQRATGIALASARSHLDEQRSAIAAMERASRRSLAARCQKPKSARLRGSGFAIILWIPIGNSRICPVVSVCLRNGTSA